MLAVCPSGKRCPVQRHSPEAASQTLRVLSLEPETMRSPPGSHAHARAESEWPGKVSRHLPEAASQTLRVLSWEPETRWSAPGLHPHARAEPVWRGMVGRHQPEAA